MDAAEATILRAVAEPPPENRFRYVLNTHTLVRMELRWDNESRFESLVQLNMPEVSFSSVPELQTDERHVQPGYQFVVAKFQV